MTSANRPSVSATRGPVTVVLSAPSRGIARGSTVELTLLVTIAPGWTIASVKGDPTGTRRATSIQLGAAEGLLPGAMRIPEGAVDPLGGERLAEYAGTIAIQIPLSVTEECLPGPAPIAARLLFQATGEGRTLPPDQVEVEAEFDVATGQPGQPGQAGQESSRLDTSA